jgi:hypothetical protein
LKRWVLALLFPVALGAAVAGFAWEQTGAVLQTWVMGIFLLPVVGAAGMLGVALTVPFARRHVFDGSPYPDLFRLVVSLALGMGALALGMLGLGSLHLLDPAGISLTPHPSAFPLFPALLLMVAGGIGFLPTRTFWRHFDRTPIKKRIGRGLGGGAGIGEWYVLLAAVPVAVMVIAATFPPGTLWTSEGRGYDVLEYHLELPREYVAANSTAPLGHNVYSYFPQNVEMLYTMTMQLARFAMGEPGGGGVAAARAGGGYLWGIFPSQFLHVMLMILAGMGMALAPVRMSTAARILAVVLFLSIPWTIVTGSLAYNEGGMMLFGTLALVLALRSPRQDAAGGGGWSRMVLVGILLGLAMGCKLTAGLFFALPVAVILVGQGGMGEKQEASSKKQEGLGAFLALRWIVVAAVVALGVYSPWAIRAAVYSGGNPVFPLAATVLPRDGWTAEEAGRFARGHAAKEGGQAVGLLNVGARSRAVFREFIAQPLWSPGWASIYDWAKEHVEEAAWKRIGVVWVIVPVAIVLAVIAGLRRGGMTVTAFLLVALVLQVVAWMFATHLQSRFLLPAAIPLCLLIALGSQGLGESGGLSVGVLAILISVVVGVQALCCSFLLLPEADLLGGTVAREGRAARVQPIGILLGRNLVAEFEGMGELPERQQPHGTVLLVGDAAPLWYEGTVVYNTVFDRNELAEQLRAGGAVGAVKWLRERGVNYVVVNWPEVERLRGTYGFDEAITPAAIDGLIQAGLEVVPAPGWKGVVVLRVKKAS